MYCKNCGKELTDDSKFCPGCGAVQEVGEQTPFAPVEDSQFQTTPAWTGKHGSEDPLENLPNQETKAITKLRGRNLLLIAGILAIIVPPFFLYRLGFYTYTILQLLAYAIFISAGIFGIIFRNKPEKTKLLVMIGLILIAICIVHALMILVVFASYDISPFWRIGWATGYRFIISALYLFGALQNKKPPIIIEKSNAYAQSGISSNPLDRKSGGYAVLGFFFPVVGLILFLVWKDAAFPLRARSAGKGALISVIIGAALSLVAGIIIVVIGIL
ncbi:MAG: zinc-ribbon domain-containing protein [Clostridiales Family XIII bacterium]|jgi:hypothetical protein|nr:zinc-ribbon domain-containing protein [Clostridiales Family XIII bacterium]